MVRRALPLSVALALMLGCTDASARQTTIPVRGEVKAIALAGDALIVARQPAQGGLALERLAPGSPAQMLLRLPRSGDDNDDIEVSLASSAQALAVSAQDTSGDFNPSQVFAGPSAGRLRQVATCASGLLPAPVAVSGLRIAWVEGGCGDPPRRPRAATPASIVIGGADAAVPLRRVAAGEEALPAALVLSGEAGLAGVLRPSFFSFFKSEVRRFGPSGFGATVARENSRVVVPVGVLSNGDEVLLFSGSEDSAEGGDGSSDPSCDATVFVIPAGAGERRKLPLAGCSDNEDFTGSTVRVAGDRVYSLVDEPRRRKSRAPTPVAIKSLHGDGVGARVVARGTYRSPRGLAAADPARVAWWQRSCVGDSEIVIDDGAGPASAPSIRSCLVNLVGRSVPLRGSAIRLRLRCPTGCSGQAIVKSRRSRLVRSFSFERGTHSLRLRLTRGERRRKQLRLRFSVAGGPTRRATIRLR